LWRAYKRLIPDKSMHDHTNTNIGCIPRRRGQA
jgi:hypothetical protein